MKEIMVIRFSSIGDIVLCTPVIRLLKKRFPESKITFVTKSKFVHLLSKNPYIERILCWDHDLQRVELSQIQFDIIVDLHSNLRSLMVKLRFWQVPSLSLSKKNLNKFLYTITKWNFFKVDSIVQRSIQTLMPLGISDDKEGLDFQVSDIEVSSELEFGLLDDYLVVVLGGTYFTKRIPENKLEEFFRSFPKNKIALIGGKEEFELGKRLEKKYEGSVVSFCGQLSIEESAKLMSRSKVVISGDTGMAHIAAALGCSIGLIWGNTAPGYGMSPVVKEGVEIEHFVVPDLNCWPCSKLGYSDCPKGHFKCMQGQNMVEVSKFVEKYL